LIKKNLKDRVYVEIATHDWSVIEEVLLEGFNPEMMEFQFLLGVQLARKRIIPRLQKLRSSVRLYTPVELEQGSGINYGRRRAKEDPLIAWHIIKNLAQIKLSHTK